MPETHICPECGDLAEKVGFAVPVDDDGTLGTIYVWCCPSCEWVDDAHEAA